MNSEFYPDNWRELADEIKAANHFICQACGQQCRQEPTDRSKPVLTVAHYDHEYEGETVFLACLCVRCHLIHDAPFGWQARRRHERVRRRQAGQLTLEFLVQGKRL